MIPDLMSFGVYIGLVILGILIGALLLIWQANMRVGGFWKRFWASFKKLPTAIYGYMDGWAEYKILTKRTGSVVFNQGTDHELIDRTMFEPEPMLNIEGNRTFLASSASAIPTTINETGEISRVIAQVMENKERYPLVSKLKDFEIFGGLGHDPITVRELMARHCGVDREYVDDNGEKQKRTDLDIKIVVNSKVNEYMAEFELLRKDLKFTPRRDIFIDLPRVIDSTQQRVAQHVLKTYRTELENMFRNMYGNQSNDKWKFALFGFAAGLILFAIGSAVGVV